MRRITSGDSSGPSYAGLSGRDPRDLPLPDHLRTRTLHLERIARRGPPVNFVKTHLANVRLGGSWLIPAHLTRQVIYLVRHPLDLLASYADHWGVSPVEAARQMGDPRNVIPANQRTAAQFLGDWSSHVAGWTRARDFPVLTLRYEDMPADPEASFTAVLRHIGAPVDRAVLAQSIERASFPVLAAMETAGGFPERGPAQKRFFRAGRAGEWRDVVPEDVADRVVRAHRTAMKRLRYL